MTDLDRKYHGDGKPHYKPLDRRAEKNLPERYVADESIKKAVNLALFLRRPLLLEGDPGCGKTRLAYAVAYELGFPMFTCYVRSTTRAENLLYTFDRLKRLYDIEEIRAGAKTATSVHDETASGPGAKKSSPDRKLPDMKTYVDMKNLGKAIEKSQDFRIPSVVLIDEVDKADPDFPNDLLQTLEEWRFHIDETGETIDAGKKNGPGERNLHLPLVIITSNREKELPAPFLRRCLYHYIEFPDHDTMKRIIGEHFEEEPTDLFWAAVRKFMWLRGKESGIKWQKPPSTSELIDWINALLDMEKSGDMTAEKLEKCGRRDLPLPGVLVKCKRDRDELCKT